MASAKTSRVILLALIVVAVALTALVVAPFATAFFIAAVLAGALSPLMEALSRKFRGRRGLAAGVITFALLVAVILPVAALTTVLVKQVASAVQWIRDAIASEGVAGLVTYLPRSLQPYVAGAIGELPQGLAELERLASAQTGRAAAVVGGVLSWTTTLLFQTAMFLVAFFFLLTDGRRLIAWLNEVVPLQRGHLAELLGEFRRVTVAVLVSTLATGGVQTLLAGFGYLVARVPNAIFFMFMTFVFALVPALGATVGVIAVALLQLATGHKLAAIFLLVWAFGVVALVDNVVKPLFMRGFAGGLEVHAAVIFFSLLGGLAAFGPSGLIAGPLVISFLIAVLRMYRRDYGGTS